MATATSAPELFVNVVGTFVTESDIGIGTVSGSNLFNTLGVAALGGLAASSVRKLSFHSPTDCQILTNAKSNLDPSRSHPPNETGSHV